MPRGQISTPLPTQFDKDLIEAVLEGKVGLSAYRYAWEKRTGRNTYPPDMNMNLAQRIRFLKERFELDPEPILKLLPARIRRRIRTKWDLERFIRG
jgi:hypothetical protein